MKHAGATSLASLALLLNEIRSRTGLTEKKPGIFYRKSKAFLHFHEDKAGIFMDLRDGDAWLRLPASDHSNCLIEMDRILAGN